MPFLFDIFMESRAFRNEACLEKHSPKELCDMLFTMLLTLHLMGMTKFNRDVDHYCQETLKYPMFDKVYLSGTDMGNVIASLRNAREILDEKNVDIPVMELKRYLRTGFQDGMMHDSLKRMLFQKLQSKLGITNSLLTSLRRDIVDSYELTWSQKKVLGERLYQLMRKYEYRCDVTLLLQRLMDTSHE